MNANGLPAVRNDCVCPIGAPNCTCGDAERRQRMARVKPTPPDPYRRVLKVEGPDTHLLGEILRRELRASAKRIASARGDHARMVAAQRAALVAGWLDALRV